MFFAYLTLISALLLAAVAGVFSVTGMMALFAGIPMAGAAVGIAVELGKIMGVSWLYRHWNEGVWFRYLMAATVVVAMLVTSIGVYGYLSKAHYDQGKDYSNDSAKVQVLDEKIQRMKSNIDRKKDTLSRTEESLGYLDSQIAVLVKNKKISDEKNGSRAVMKEQQPERDKLNNTLRKTEAEIDALHEQVSALENERFTAGNTVRSFEVEVGPLKSIAGVMFDDTAGSMDRAIRVVIIMIMIALDPMAIMLLMGYNHIMMSRDGSAPPTKGGDTPDKKPRKKIGDIFDSFKKAELVQTAPKVEEPKLEAAMQEEPLPEEVIPKKSEVGTRVPVRHDVINGVMTTVPISMNEKDRIALIKNKINSPPKSKWINNITTKRN